MNVFESFAHALLQEHGRNLFLRTYSSPGGYGITFWKNALVAYGQKFYMMPRLMGLTEPKGDYAFPAFTVKNSLELGLPLPEMLRYKTMGDYGHQYTPIHLGTGLTVYGHGQLKEEADTLFQVDFMKKLLKTKKSPQDFASQSVVNPYTPFLLNRQVYADSLLREDPDDPDSPYVILDELGNAAWFPLEYTKDIVKTVDAELWFHTAWMLAHVADRLAPLKDMAAYPLISRGQMGRRWKAYESQAKYARALSPMRFGAFFEKTTGVMRVIGCFRGDVDSETMATGLRVIAASQSSTMEKAYQYIGRALTYDDLKKLSASHLVEILRCCHFDTVKTVITEDSERLSALLFKAPPNMLRIVSDCMTEKLGSRMKYWYPDTDEGTYGLHRLQVQTEKFDHFREWQVVMQPKMSQYFQRRAWRDGLLQMADPDVAFLALTLVTAKPGDPVPTHAIMNVLKSHPNIGPLLEHVRELGEHPYSSAL